MQLPPSRMGSGVQGGHGVKTRCWVHDNVQRLSWGRATCLHCGQSDIGRMHSRDGKEEDCGTLERSDETRDTTKVALTGTVFRTGVYCSSVSMMGFVPCRGVVTHVGRQEPCWVGARTTERVYHLIFSRHKKKHVLLYICLDSCTSVCMSWLGAANCCCLHTCRNIPQAIHHSWLPKATTSRPLRPMYPCRLGHPHLP